MAKAQSKAKRQSKPFEAPEPSPGVEAPKEEVEIGRITISESTSIIVRQTTLQGKQYVDIRKFITTDKYTGWTQKGITISLENIGEVVSILQKAK